MTRDGLRATYISVSDISARFYNIFSIKYEFRVFSASRQKRKGRKSRFFGDRNFRIFRLGRSSTLRDWFHLPRSFLIFLCEELNMPVSFRVILIVYRLFSWCFPTRKKSLTSNGRLRYDCKLRDCCRGLLLVKAHETIFFVVSTELIKTAVVVRH